MDLEADIFQDEPAVPAEFQSLSVEDLKTRTRLLDNEIRVLRDESTRLSLEASGLKERIKENAEKVLSFYNTYVCQLFKYGFQEN